MLTHHEIDIPASLIRFLDESETTYLKSLGSIALFNPEATRQWTTLQKKYFASIFYHLRGHFINFVWYIANFSHDKLIKKTILDNIAEEIGLCNALSHEMLYEHFAKACGADIQDEIINETHYLPFAREFNRTHLQWLSNQDNEERVAAFAAYERLDNLDYPQLVEMAKTFKLPRSAMTFFNVHVHVHHFDSTLDLILPIWEKYPEKVRRAFHFINSHQHKMWSNLSAAVSALA